MSEENQILTIDIVSDVVCPWRYLGEKRLEEALAEEAGPVAVRWRPYQLDPTIPQGGLDRAENAGVLWQPGLASRRVSFRLHGDQRLAVECAWAFA
jgi:predicted DsbA family dithiol-disulfide isomerase